MEKTIGQKLRQLRIEAELTQQEVAKHLSVLDKTVSRYELGKTNPSYSMLHELALYFSVPLSYLIDDNLKYKKSKVQQLLDELVKSGDITDINNMDKLTQDMIISAVKIDLAMQLKKRKSGEV